jgi:hypothetical protein
MMLAKLAKDADKHRALLFPEKNKRRIRSRRARATRQGRRTRAVRALYTHSLARRTDQQAGSCRPGQRAAAPSWQACPPVRHGLLPCRHGAGIRLCRHPFGTQQGFGQSGHPRRARHGGMGAHAHGPRSSFTWRAPCCRRAGRSRGQGARARRTCRRRAVFQVRALAARGTGHRARLPAAAHPQPRGHPGPAPSPARDSYYVRPRPLEEA